MEDMLRACVLDLKSDWNTHLPLIEFAYNNSYQVSILMTPFESLYGKCCRTPIYWKEVGEQKLLGPDYHREDLFDSRPTPNSSKQTEILCRQKERS